MTLATMIHAEIRRSRLRLQSADAEDLESAAMLEMLSTGATARRAVSRVVMRYRRACARRPLALRIDVAAATCPRDYKRPAKAPTVA